MDLEPEGFQHAAPHRVRKFCDLAPCGGQCVHEGRGLPNRSPLPVGGDLGFLGLDLLIEFGDARLDPLDEAPVGIVGEFEGVELALPSLTEVPQSSVQRLVPFRVPACLTLVGRGQRPAQAAATTSPANAAHP
ncbi:hypothetical protein ACFVFQ_28085 [Streptomyces sp. NPDC057743]|uniref:hypothetical protein n=1 Tax=Streptomyces sp. NPDC057743 TaxID=3346236 RepID=UPI0036C574AB